MAQLLMPKATAVWLVENTGLTFDQIADFCELHQLEVQGIADGEVAVGITGLDPTTNGQLTRDEITACEEDRARRLTLADSTLPAPVVRAKGPRYTPVAKRQDRPNAISWLLRFHPELSDGQISKLVGTTKPTINAIRDRTHWNISNLKLEDPVSLGMCSQLELDQAVSKAAARQRSRERRVTRETRKTDRTTLTTSESVTRTLSSRSVRAKDEKDTARGREKTGGAAPLPIWSTTSASASKETLHGSVSTSKNSVTPEKKDQPEGPMKADQIFSSTPRSSSEGVSEEETLDPDKIFSQPGTSLPSSNDDTKKNEETETPKNSPAQSEDSSP